MTIDDKKTAQNEQSNFKISDLTMSIDPHSTKSKISGLYNKVASLYDQVGPQTYAQFGNILVEDADLSLGWRVLDVATGRGAVLIPATNQVSNDGMAVGVDLAFGMLQLTKAACQAKAMLKAAVVHCAGDRCYGAHPYLRADRQTP